jgi:hypothetical protein
LAQRSVAQNHLCVLQVPRLSFDRHLVEDDRGCNIRKVLTPALNPWIQSASQFAQFRYNVCNLQFGF